MAKKIEKTEVTNSVSCPTCKARKGVRCKGPSGNPIMDHKSRQNKYQSTRPAGPLDEAAGEGHDPTAEAPTEDLSATSEEEPSNG